MTNPDIPAAEPPRPWPFGTTLAFRFLFVYFGLYTLTTQMLGGLLPIPGLNVPSLNAVPPLRPVVLWVGHHILGIEEIPLVPTGSGDTLFDWVHVFTLLLIATLATAVWSALERRKRSTSVTPATPGTPGAPGTRGHPRLYRWFRLFVRFGLGTTFLLYGSVKFIPLQMPAPGLTRLLEPYGHFSPMGVLWYSIGAAHSYERFVGLAEMGAGILLFVPRTALLGAVVALMDGIAVFVLNMTYDVPVKLFSFHLVLMALFLLAPNLPRLAELFLAQRTTRVLPEPPLGRTPRARRGWLIAQVVFGIWAVGMALRSGMQAWTAYGGGAPRSPLYGIWDVERMTVDGEPRPALISDTTRWRRVVFDRPTVVSFQRMTDTFVGYPVAVDTVSGTVVITEPDSARTERTLTYQRPSPERLVLEGPLGGHQVRLEMAYVDPESFLLRSRGFNWVQQFPFNR